MKSKELKQKDRAELLKMVHEKKGALRALRSGLAGSRSKNVKEVGNLRKEIARMLTEITAKVAKK